MDQTENNNTENLQNPEIPEPVESASANQPEQQGSIKDISDLFAEDVEPVKEIESAEVDESDFSVDKTGKLKEDPAKEDEEKKAPGPEKKPEPKSGSSGSATGDNEKNAAIKRMFNPETAMLMFDILAKRAGRMATPDRPNYFRMNEEDREDFQKLLGHAAQEEDWSSIPSKYLLMVAGAFWLFGKVYKWNKPHLWDETEAGKSISSPKQEKERETQDNESVAAYIRERAKYDSDTQYKDLQEMVRQLSHQAAIQNKNIQNLLDIIQGNMPFAGAGAAQDSGGVQDVPFVEIAPERFLDEYDMEIIEFTPGGCIVDKTKAGTDGFTIQGRKDGKPSQRDGEIQRHFNKYHAWKKKNIKKAA